jgi:hypothetical protein
VFAGHATASGSDEIQLAPARVGAFALVGLLALTGCGQPPGFELSWRIGDTLEDAAPLTAVKQCSDVGIFSVRVTISLGDAVVPIDEFPCFSIVEGPPLEPGEYTVEVEGLRRSGEPWAFDPELDAQVDRIAYDSASVIVSDGALPSVEVVLLAPPECDDGIDNDRDGVVDGQDPGCEVLTPTGEPSEGNDADVTLFQLAVTFLDSPAVEPLDVGVQHIQLAVDGELLIALSNAQLDLEQWPFRLPLVSGEFVGGNHELSVTAIDSNGALTETQVLEFTTTDDQGTYVAHQFDFGSEAFLQPVVEPLALVFEPDCSPGGTLALERMWIRVVDETDTALDVAALGLTGSTVIGGSGMSILPIDEAGGWVSFECPSSVVRSTDLAWGGYRVQAQARRADDVTCYESPIGDLSPQPVSAQTLALERVLIDELPACPECTADADCSGQTCNDGLCVDKDPG